MGNTTFVDRPAWISIRETYRHGFHYKKHTSTIRNTGKQGKKTATAMHQSRFSSQNDLLWAGSPFRNKGNSDHVHTRSHMQRVKESSGAYRDQKTPKYTLKRSEIRSTPALFHPQA